MFLGYVPYWYCCTHGRSWVCGEMWMSPRKRLKKKCLDVIISRARGDWVMRSLMIWMRLLLGWSLSHKSMVKYFQWNKISDKITPRAFHLHFNLRQREKNNQCSHAVDGHISTIPIFSTNFMNNAQTMTSVITQSCLNVKIFLYLFISACLISTLLFFYWREKSRRWP